MNSHTYILHILLCITVNVCLSCIILNLLECLHERHCLMYYISLSKYQRQLLHIKFRTNIKNISATWMLNYEIIFMIEIIICSLKAIITSIKPESLGFFWFISGRHSCLKLIILNKKQYCVLVEKNTYNKDNMSRFQHKFKLQQVYNWTQVRWLPHSSIPKKQVVMTFHS